MVTSNGYKGPVRNTGARIYHPHCPEYRVVAAAFQGFFARIHGPGDEIPTVFVINRVNLPQLA